MHRTEPIGRNLEKLRTSHTRSTFTKSASVLVVVSKKLSFNKPGVKTNRQVTLNKCETIVPMASFFQQDGALADIRILH